MAQGEGTPNSISGMVSRWAIFPLVGWSWAGRWRGLDPGAVRRLRVSYCGQAYPIVQQVQKHFGKRLRLVFRNFPLERNASCRRSCRRSGGVCRPKASSGRYTINCMKIRTLGRSTLFGSRRKAHAIHHYIASGVGTTNVRSPYPCRLQGPVPEVE
jgi:hypothetical protein